jgi:hypothetical protein
MRSLVVGLILAAGASSASAELVMARVLGENVSIKTRPSLLSDVMMVVQPDERLEVLGKEGGWFWVLMARDHHGVQRAGWVREHDIELLNGAAQYFVPTPVAAPKVEEPEPEKVEKPKKADDGKLRRAQQELEKARQAYEKLTARTPGSEQGVVLLGEPVMVGEPIVEPLQWR